MLPPGRLPAPGPGCHRAQAGSGKTKKKKKPAKHRRFNFVGLSISPRPSHLKKKNKLNLFSVGEELYFQARGGEMEIALAFVLFRFLFCVFFFSGETEENPAERCVAPTSVPASNKSAEK